MSSDWPNIEPRAASTPTTRSSTLRMRIVRPTASPEGKKRSRRSMPITHTAAEPSTSKGSRKRPSWIVLSSMRAMFAVTPATCTASISSRPRFTSARLFSWAPTSSQEGQRRRTASKSTQVRRLLRRSMRCHCSSVKLPECAIRATMKWFTPSTFATRSVT